MAEENLHKGHRVRMREKCINFGTEQLQDHELIEMILNYCIPMKNTNPTAHKLLIEYGNISNIISASPKDIVNRLNCTVNTALIFSLISEVIKRCNKERLQIVKMIDNEAAAGEYALSLLGGIQDTEKFYIIGLDSTKKLIGSVLIGKGTVNETNIYPRQVVEEALRIRSSSIILAHNHPSGSLIPSSSDISLTSYITNVFNLIGIDVVDHIIVSSDKYISMSHIGLIKNRI